MRAEEYTLADWRALEARLSETLAPARFRHTLGVSDTACALALRYDESFAHARLAGLLHDCAKGLSPETLLEIVQRESLEIRDSERSNPSLLHAPVGAWLAVTDYGVEEENVRDAIRHHTTGRPDMTLLEKIIYVADFIEPARVRAPELAAIRKMAFQDLEETVAAIAESTVTYILEREIPLDDMTKETRDWYRAHSGKGEEQ